MAIAGGFRVHDEGNLPRYRVPDLLTRDEFLSYMASNYGVGIDFRDLTDEEREKLEKGERLVAPTPASPLRTDAEIIELRRMLGIDDLEKKINVNRSVDPKDRDPIVEMDSKILSPEEFEKKYGKAPDSSTEESDEKKSTTSTASRSSTTKKAS